LPTVLQQNGWINARVDSLGTYKQGLGANLMLDWTQESLTYGLRNMIGKLKKVSTGKLKKVSTGKQYL
jgi:hypothetical protein